MGKAKAIFSGREESLQFSRLRLDIAVDGQTKAIEAKGFFVKEMKDVLMVATEISMRRFPSSKRRSKEVKAKFLKSKQRKKNKEKKRKRKEIVKVEAN